jgi:hypothetical protein
VLLLFDWNWLIICAFCFRTSAGVRMRHDTISAVEDAIPCIMGVGRECVNGRWNLSRVPFVEDRFLFWLDLDELCKMLFTVS